MVILEPSSQGFGSFGWDLQERTQDLGMSMYVGLALCCSQEQVAAAKQETEQLKVRAASGQALLNRSRNSCRTFCSWWMLKPTRKYVHV